MKKLFILPFLFIIGFSSITAQTYYGNKIGLNLSNVSGEYKRDVTEKMLVKMHFGAYLNFELNSRIQLQPELLYQGMGGELYRENIFGASNEFKDTYDDKIRMNYITLPIMLKYFFSNAFFGEFGPQLGFALSQRVKYHYVNEYSAGQFTIDDGERNIDDQYLSVVSDENSVKKFDFALGLGIGYEFQNGLNLNARYNFSMIPFVDDDYRTIKSRVLMIGLGYTVNFIRPTDDQSK